MTSLLHSLSRPLLHSLPHPLRRARGSATQEEQGMHPTDRLLRLALRSNAAFSTSCALIALSTAEPLAAWLGVPDPELLIGLGIQLLVFAAFLVWLSTRARIQPAIALGVIAADAAWVVGTVPVVALGGLSSPGVFVALGIADAVALLGILQGIGLRRMRRSAPGTA